MIQVCRGQDTHMLTQTHAHENNPMNSFFQEMLFFGKDVFWRFSPAVRTIYEKKSQAYYPSFARQCLTSHLTKKSLNIASYKSHQSENLCGDSDI